MGKTYKDMDNKRRHKSGGGHQSRFDNPEKADWDISFQYNLDESPDDRDSLGEHDNSRQRLCKVQQSFVRNDSAGEKPRQQRNPVVDNPQDRLFLKGVEVDLASVVKFTTIERDKDFGSGPIKTYGIKFVFADAFRIVWYGTNSVLRDTDFMRVQQILDRRA